VAIAAILTGKTIAQKYVEPGKRRMSRRLHEGLERHHAWQFHFEGRAVYRAIVVGDDVHALKEDGLDRILPGPQGQGVIAQRPKIRVEHKGRKTAGRNVHVQATLLDLLKAASRS